MNKKGFTLIELLAVIAIIALISLIAIPNIAGLQDGVKKDQVLDDAKKLISMAKYKVNTDYEIRNFTKNATGITCNSSTKTCQLSFSILNTNNDIDKDPDSSNGSNYTGYVEYSERIVTGDKSVIKYCVYLEGTKRKVCKETTQGCTSCVDEDELYSRRNVHDK